MVEWRDPTGGPQHGPDAEPVRRAFESLGKKVADEAAAAAAATSAVSAAIAALGTWQAFTPTLTQGATPTKTVVAARYTKIGKLVIANVHLNVTSAGTANNAIRIGLPIASVTPGVSGVVGSGDWFTSVGAVTIPGVADLITSTTVGIQVYINGVGFGNLGSAGSINAGALANTDVLRYAVAYEVA